LNGSVYDISRETLPSEAGRTVTLSTPEECIGILIFTPLDQNKIKASFMKNAGKKCSFIIKLKCLYIYQHSQHIKNWHRPTKNKIAVVNFSLTCGRTVTHKQ